MPEKKRKHIVVGLTKTNSQKCALTTEHISVKCKNTISILLT